MNKIRCLYCDKEKEADEYSLEHIFPDALGGSLFSEVFKTRRVCERCNSISGLFIDGPFIKNIFSKIDASKAYGSTRPVRQKFSKSLTVKGFQLN
jgi:hypothetical protein